MIFFWQIGQWNCQGDGGDKFCKEITNFTMKKFKRVHIEKMNSLKYIYLFRYLDPLMP